MSLGMVCAANASNLFYGNSLSQKLLAILARFANVLLAYKLSNSS